MSYIIGLSLFILLFSSFISSTTAQSDAVRVFRIDSAILGAYPSQAERARQMEPELKFVYLKGVIEGEREHDITLRWSTDDGSLQRLETKTIAWQLPDSEDVVFMTRAADRIPLPRAIPDPEYNLNRDPSPNVNHSDAFNGLDERPGRDGDGTSVGKYTLDRSFTFTVALQSEGMTYSSQIAIPPNALKNIGYYFANTDMNLRIPLPARTY